MLQQTSAPARANSKIIAAVVTLIADVVTFSNITWPFPQEKNEIIGHGFSAMMRSQTLDRGALSKQLRYSSIIAFGAITTFTTR